MLGWNKIIGLSFRKRKDGYDFIVTTDEAYNAADGWHEGDEEHTIFFKSDCTWQDIRISLDAINYHFQKEVENRFEQSHAKSLTLLVLISLMKDIDNFIVGGIAFILKNSYYI